MSTGWVCDDSRGFPTTQTYDVITIGRALHWLERDATLAVLERILAPDFGRILICRATSAETPETAWVTSYREVCHAWTTEPEERRYGIDEKEWFTGSCFRVLGETSVAERRQVRIADLIGRALSKSNTSPEILAEGQARFEAEIAAALQPFVRDGADTSTAASSRRSAAQSLPSSVANLSSDHSSPPTTPAPTARSVISLLASTPSSSALRRRLCCACQWPTARLWLPRMFPRLT